jgi:hypothetical protein
VFVKEDWGENQQFFNTTTPMPMGPALKDNLPEVESFTRFAAINAMVKVGEQAIQRRRSAGRSFRIFSVRF